MSPDPAALSAVDPTNPQTWNRYAYVMNNPLSNIDPTGLGGPYPCGPAGCNIPGAVNCGAPGGIPGQGGCNTSGNFPSLANIMGSWSSFTTVTSTSTIGWVQSNLYDIDPNTGQLTLVSGGQTAVTLTNSYIVGNGGGSYPANNGTPPVCNSTTGICVPARMVPPPGYSPLQWLKKKTVGLLCGSSPQGAVESWMETGATKGAFAGAVAGGGAAGVATFGIGGAPGAVLGGFLGGVVGASGGALSGGMAAGACSAAGVYGSGS